MVRGELTPAERKEVAQAIASVRARTKAQFALVIVPDSDHYRFYPPIWAACVALIAAGIIAFAFPHLGLRLAFVIQAAIFAVLTLALEWRPLRLFVAPPGAKRAAAHAFAERAFTNRVLAHPDRKGGVPLLRVAGRTLHRSHCRQRAALCGRTRRLGEDRRRFHDSCRLRAHRPRLHRRHQRLRRVFGKASAERRLSSHFVHT